MATRQGKAQLGKVHANCPTHLCRSRLRHGMLIAGVDLTSPRAVTILGLGLVIAAAWIALSAVHAETGLALEGIAAL